MTTSTSNLSLAIVGCGAITEQFYLPALLRLRERFGNLFFVDPAVDRAQALADRVHGASAATDLDSVTGQIHAAVNATPHHLHQRLNLQLLEAGIPVLCEKPLAETSEQLEELLKAQQRAGVPVLVNNTRRLLPSYREVRRLVHSGEFGAVRRVFFHEGGEFSWPSVSGFYFDASISPKGVLLDRGAHVLDLVCWWLDGRPEVVSFRDDSFGGPEAVCQLEARLGEAAVDVRLSWLSKLANRFEVECEGGIIAGDIYDFFGVVVRRDGSAPVRRQLPSAQRAFMEFGLPLMENFLDVLAGDVPPLVDAAAVQPSIRLLDDCYARRERFSLPWYPMPERARERSA